MTFDVPGGSDEPPAPRPAAGKKTSLTRPEKKAAPATMADDEDEGGTYSFADQGRFLLLRKALSSWPMEPAPRL